MTKFDIPMYQVCLRHPDFGWQVVNTAYNFDSACGELNHWVNKTDGLIALDVRRVSDKLRETWSIVRRYDPRTKAQT